MRSWERSGEDVTLFCSVKFFFENKLCVCEHAVEIKLLRIFYFISRSSEPRKVKILLLLLC